MRKVIVGSVLFLAACAVSKPLAIPRIATIGVVSGNSVADFGSNSPRMLAFLDALRARGFQEGRNFTLEIQAVTPAPGGATPEALQNLRNIVTSEVARGASVIVADQSTTALAAMESAGNVPVIFWSGDPLAEGLVRSLAHPGTNATGITFLHDQPLVTLQLVRIVKPNIKRLGVIFNPSYAPGGALLQKLQTAAATLGMEVNAVQIDAPGDFDRAFQMLQEWHAEAVIATNHSMFRRNAAQLAASALNHRIPLISPYTELADAGALLSWTPDFQFWSDRAAEYVKRILSGIEPGDIPVEESVPWRFVVNLQTARILGIAIPAEVRQRARVIGAP